MKYLEIISNSLSTIVDIVKPILDIDIYITINFSYYII